MYKEPLRLPVENLPGALGDTRKLSVSNGLEGSKGQAVIDGQRPLDHRQDQETRDRGLGGDRHSGGTPGPCSEASWKRLRYPLPQGSLARWGGAPIGPFDWRPFEKLSRAVADTQSCRLCVNHVTAAHRFPPGQGAPVTVPGGLQTRKGSTRGDTPARSLPVLGAARAGSALPASWTPACCLQRLHAGPAHGIWSPAQPQGPAAQGPCLDAPLPAQGSCRPVGHPGPWTFPTWGCRALQGHPLT